MSKPRKLYFTVEVKISRGAEDGVQSHLTAKFNGLTDDRPPADMVQDIALLLAKGEVGRAG